MKEFWNVIHIIWEILDSGQTFIVKIKTLKPKIGHILPSVVGQKQYALKLGKYGIALPKRTFPLWYEALFALGTVDA